jgi:hypothetical protein
VNANEIFGGYIDGESRRYEVPRLNNDQLAIVVADSECQLGVRQAAQRELARRHRELSQSQRRTRSAHHFFHGN